MSKRWTYFSVQEQELQGRISDLERELEVAILKLEQFESKENRDVENSELLMAEYNAAFQDLNGVVEVGWQWYWILISILSLNHVLPMTIVLVKH